MCSGLALVHRQPRVLVFQQHPQDLIQAGVGGNRNNVHARRHDLARVDVPQVQQLLDGDLLEAFQVPFLAAGFDDELQLFGGMAASAASAPVPARARAPARQRSTTNTNGSAMR